MVETYITLALKQRIDEFVGKNLDSEELENWIGFILSVMLDDLEGE